MFKDDIVTWFSGKDVEVNVRVANKPERTQ